MSSSGAVARLYCRWEFARSALYQGWWMLTSYSMVTDAGLDARQVLVIASVQAVASLLCEAPAGVLADTVSRRWSLVVFHGLRATAMILAGLFPAFWPLLVANTLNGVSWTFSSGADVAWLTDELDNPQRVPATLIRAGRWALTGSAVGMALCGTAAALLGRPPVMVTAGVAMAGLGLMVARTFPERHFRRAPGNRLRAARDVAATGARLTWRDPTLLVLLVVTMLVNGAYDSTGRVYPVALHDQGLPATGSGTADYAALTITGLLLGSVSLRMAENRVDGERSAARGLAFAATAGVVSLLLIGWGAHLAAGMLGVLIFGGVATPLTRTVTTVWVNRRLTSPVRATVHSFFGQAENLGEMITAGLLALLAAGGDLHSTTAGGAVLLGVSALLVLSRARDHEPPRAAGPGCDTARRDEDPKGGDDGAARR